jgi:hypothetical protein
MARRAMSASTARCVRSIERMLLLVFGFFSETRPDVSTACCRM